MASAPTPYTGQSGARRKHFRSRFSAPVTRAKSTSRPKPRKLYPIKYQNICPISDLLTSVFVSMTEEPEKIPAIFCQTDGEKSEITLVPAVGMW